MLAEAVFEEKKRVEAGGSKAADRNFQGAHVSFFWRGKDFPPQLLGSPTAVRSLTSDAIAAFFSSDARRGSRNRSCSDALAPESAPRIEENALDLPSEMAWDLVSAITSGGVGGCCLPWTS